MIDYFSSAAAQLGVSAWVIILIVIWEAVWTAIAMWRAAKNNHIFWFVVFFLVNLLAIPEIIYLVVTRKKNSKRKR
jgi:hypothetical protein